jgi:modulator of FtsH protease HflK
MAWNEPGGGGKDRDPWGNRGGEQGPPDLDEAFRKLQARLSGMFGGRGRGGDGEGGGGSGFNPLFGLGVVGAALLIWFVAGIYMVDEQERGVVFRFGAVLDDVVMPGVHWNPRIIDRVERVNVTRVEQFAHHSLMLTRDENIVDVRISVQYIVSDPVKFVTQVQQPIRSLEQAAESALRHVVGSSLMDQVITEGRAAMGIDLRERLQSYVNHYGSGIFISTVNVDQSGPPREVQAAFDEVQKAKEDEIRIANQATAYAEEIIPRARGEAQQQIERANAYRDQVVSQALGEADRFQKLLAEYQQAPAVTRNRLYIDAMETVLQNSSKVLVNLENGNNLMYLPLDRMGRAANDAPEQLVQPRSLEAREPQRQEQPQLLRRQPRG